ncbi:MAG: efflux RND transporter permease subunit [Cryomorphaceae bacterium]|nr:efflux RND transporter permease subunit [Cryomorphaceae bacterium]
MNLSSLSIERPVLTTVFSIVIALFGIIGFTYLGVREFPNVDPPIVTVTTNYPGANASIVETQITDVVEENISGIAGIRTISSTSSDGRSTVRIEFELGVDMEAAANDVRDKVGRAVRLLPPDSDPPIVVKSDADSDVIISITVQSKKRSLLELSEFGNNVFKERLQTIQGVSEIRIWGEKKYAMKLLMDPMRLNAYGITPMEVQNALNRENVELPSGRIEGNRTELTIRTFGRLSTEEEFDNLIIKEEDGQLIRFKDIGQARLLPENERSLLRGNDGIPMIGVAITPQPGVNYLEIVDEVYARLEQIKREIPEDLKLGVALDSTIPIRQAISEVKSTILISFGLVVLIIFLFLRNWRTTLIPIVAIPVSLIGAFFVLYISGYSINILTLLGIVLATGLVVDDAIVMMENIYTKIERGEKPKAAGHEGSREIYFAIISTTITLICVFMPIIFLQGLTGRLFREFGVVVSGAVIISTFVSLSLTPMLSTKLLRKKANKGAFFYRTEKFFNRLNSFYAKTLEAFLEKRYLGILAMIVIAAMVYFIGTNLPSELAPLEDKSSLRIISTAPEGTSYERMNDYMSELIALTDTIPEKETLLSVTSPGFGASISVNSGFLRIRLKNPKEREKSQQQIAAELSAKLPLYGFARSFVVQEQTIGGNRLTSLPVQYVIQAPNFERLKEKLPEFMDRVNESPVFSVADLDLKFNKPEIHVTIDRKNANELGVSVADIAETLQLYFSGMRYGYFIRDGKQYEVIGQANRESRNETRDLFNLTVPNKNGEIVSMENLISTENRISPPILYRFNRYVSAKVSANTADGYSMGDGIDEMRRIADDIFDEAFSGALDGPSKEFEESSNSLIFAFLLALALIYLTLAAQFESFRDPLTIMLTVPLAIAGALLALWMFGHTFNIFSQIGIIVLIGIVTKNGILIVEFANQRKKAGLSTFDAAKDAAKERFRPILMTSMATVLGVLPIAIALGGASTSRIPMGVAIIGGLVFSLGLTLYVIPALYTYITPNIKNTAEDE